MVATAFIPNSDNKPQINHSDGNKKNNYFTNLEWSTNQENQDHARGMGLIQPPPRGYDNTCSLEVLQYDKYTLDLIKRWGSIGEASRDLKIPTTNISKSSSRKRMIAGGFIWRYSDDEIKFPKCPYCNKENKNLNYSNTQHRKVICSNCGYNFLLIL
jgi:Zn ribbon nucleic-acid-binding protein